MKAMNNKKTCTIINTSEEIQSIGKDDTHISYWGKGISVTIDYGRSNKKVTEIFQLCENVIIVNLDVHWFGL